MERGVPFMSNTLGIEQSAAQQDIAVRNIAEILSKARRQRALLNKYS